MPYAKLLNELIDKSEMSAKQIAEKCTEQGQKITASYISILRNENNDRVPSDELSRVLAKTLNVDENTLILEAYADGAPDIMKKAFKNMYKMLAFISLKAYGKNIPEEQNQFIMEEMLKQPYARLIFELAKEVNYSNIDNILTTQQNINDEEYTTNLFLNTDFEIMDDSLSPVLEKGSKVKIDIQGEYKNGDILAYKLNNDDTLRFRKLHIIDSDNYMFIPFNSEYDIEKYNKNSVKIMGKVAAVSKKL